MFSKRELEGYLEIDHRESPGLTSEEAAASAAAMGLPFLPVGKGQRLQRATITCHCCEKQVIVNPDRTRDRGYCPIHDAYACDQCHLNRVLTGVCIPMKKHIDDWWDAVDTGKIYQIWPGGDSSGNMPDV